MHTSIHIRENELSQIAVFFLDIFNLFKKLSDFDRQWEDTRLSVFRRRDVKSVCQSILFFTVPDNDALVDFVDGVPHQS